MKNNLKQIKETLDEKKQKFKAQYVWWYYCMEPVTIYMTVFFMYLRVLTPTHITLISIPFGLCGCTMVSIGGHINQLLGLCLFVMWQLLDCVDGHLARATGTKSQSGSYLDTFGAILMYGLFLLSWSIGLSIKPDEFLLYLMTWISIDYSIIATTTVAIGAVASVSVLMKLIMNVIYYNLQKINSMKEARASVRPSVKSTLSNIYSWYSRNFLELLGFFVPILAISAVFKTSSIVIIFYAMAYTIDLIINVINNYFKLHVT